jgi:hypothetical protein
VTRDAAREGDARGVLCTEPWQSYYILRRGILPCCHGGAPIAPMSEWATAWNSPALQEMRSYLARGELSPYCLRSPGCPIVQRHLARRAAAGEPTGPRSMPRRLLSAVDRALGELRGRLTRRRPG